MKPVVIVDPEWRDMDELFSAEAQKTLFGSYEVIWGRDGKIPPEVLEAALPRAAVLVAATPVVSGDVLARTPHLRAVIEVSGAFPDTIDYAACFARDIDVLSCAPGFRQSVAEMGLAMALAGARGLMSEHEAFRGGTESWLADHVETDFTLFGANIGMIGFGQIARELAQLLAPFSPRLHVHDPWLPDSIADDFGVTLAPLDDVLRHARCLFVTAAPTSENYRLLNAARLSLLQDHALLVLLSRAHLVDFDALTAELVQGRIRAAIDVFPSEPTPQDAAIRGLKNVILSPHRAAAVAGGRQLIGDLILQDLEAICAGTPERQLLRARVDTIAALAGVGDAKSVASLAKDR